MFVCHRNALTLSDDSFEKSVIAISTVFAHRELRFANERKNSMNKNIEAQFITPAFLGKPE